MTALPTRADYVAGLRQVADFIEATDLPLPTYQMGLSGSLGVWTNYASDDAASVARVGQAAQVLGVEPASCDVGANVHHTVDRAFGPIELHLSYVHNGAAKSIPGEGEEVADPAEGTGSATAPAESAAGSDPCPADEAPNAGTPESGGVSAAVPAPVATGDGAAVTPDVWVPIRRRGILYHQEREYADRRYTECGRASRPRGSWMALEDATALGAVPCPRCYGGAA